nr:acyl carrier protein [bacterium]
MSIFETVQGYIAEQLAMDASQITLESKLIDDLKADSLDIVQLIMNIEQEFGIEISDEDIAKLSSVGDIVAYIESKGK